MIFRVIYFIVTVPLFIAVALLVIPFVLGVIYVAIQFIIGLIQGLKG